MSHPELANSSNGGGRECWASWEALPGTVLHWLDSAPPWRVLCKSLSQQPAPPCWGSSQDPGLAGSSQALFLEGRKFTERVATEKILIYAIEGSRDKHS